MEFEADPIKAADNLKKHKVSFEEAASVFGDPIAYTFADPDHSVGEKRWLTFGMSANSTYKRATQSLHKYTVGCLIGETLSGSMIQLFHGERNLFFGNVSKVGPLGKVAA